MKLLKSPLFILTSILFIVEIFICIGTLLYGDRSEVHIGIGFLLITFLPVPFCWLISLPLSLWFKKKWNRVGWVLDISLSLFTVLWILIIYF